MLNPYLVTGSVTTDDAQILLWALVNRCFHIGTCLIWGINLLRICQCWIQVYWKGWRTLGDSLVREEGEFIGPFRASCLELGRGLDPSLFVYLCHEKSMPMGSFSLCFELVGIWAIAVAAFFHCILLYPVVSKDVIGDNWKFVLSCPLLYNPPQSSPGKRDFWLIHGCFESLGVDEHKGWTEMKYQVQYQAESKH